MTTFHVCSFVLPFIFSEKFEVPFNSCRFPQRRITSACWCNKLKDFFAFDGLSFSSRLAPCLYFARAVLTQSFPALCKLGNEVVYFCRDCFFSKMAFLEYITFGNIFLFLVFLLILNQLIELYEFRNMPPGPRFTSLPFIGNILSFDRGTAGQSFMASTSRFVYFITRAAHSFILHIFTWVRVRVETSEVRISDA